VPFSKSIRVFSAGLLALVYLVLLAASAPHRVHHLGQELWGDRARSVRGQLVDPAPSWNQVAIGLSRVGHAQGPEAGDSPHWPRPESTETCALSVLWAQNPGLFCAAVELAQMLPAFSLPANTAPDLPLIDRIDPRSTRGPPYRDWLV
jgi:hypothetical protein